LHLVGILFPHINHNARSKSHQICVQLVILEGFTVPLSDCFIHFCALWWRESESWNKHGLVSCIT